MKHTEATTRAALSYFWSIVVALLLGYIVYRWGDEKEILTLIIGLLGGTILGGIFGVYFGGMTNKPHGSQEGTTAEITASITTPDRPSEPKSE